MAYATQTEVERAVGGAARLTELADHDSDGVLDAAILADAQQKADAWIDAHCQRLYAVPFPTPYPQQVINIAAEETAFILKRWRDVVTEDDRTGHLERSTFLKSVQAGQAIPGTDPYPIGTGGGTPLTATRSDDDNDVTRENLKGFW